VAHRAWEAGTIGARLLGLLGRSVLESGEALWLSANGIHTFGLRFAIDVVVLDREGRVLRVEHGLSPNRVIWPVRGGRVTIEMAPGEAAHHEICRGGRIERVDS
jgi:uncharacterized membrane protein (UPF0127 family)